MKLPIWIRLWLLMPLLAFSAVFLLAVGSRTTANLPEENDTHRYFEVEYVAFANSASDNFSSGGVTSVVVSLIEQAARGSEALKYIGWLLLLCVPLFFAGRRGTNQPVLFALMLVISPIGFDLLTNAFRQCLALSLLATFFAIKPKARLFSLAVVTIGVASLVHWSVLVAVPLIAADRLKSSTWGSRSAIVFALLVAGPALALAWYVPEISARDLHYEIIKYASQDSEGDKTFVLMLASLMPLASHTIATEVRQRAGLGTVLLASVPLVIALAACALPIVGYRLLYAIYVVQALLLLSGPSKICANQYLGIPCLELNAAFQALLMLAWIGLSNYASAVFLSGLH